MGMSPSETYSLSMWEYLAVVETWNKAHGGNKGEKASDAEVSELIAYMDTVPQIIKG
jgi:hypothetical protein